MKQDLVGSTGRGQSAIFGDIGREGALRLTVAEAAPNGRKPRLFDLFCCAGGAGVGYSRAGFEIVGVDIKPQPNYPFRFIQADALTLDRKFVASFDAVHASPPCQSYSDLAKRNRNADEWPRLIEPVRNMFIQSGLPYIIENVDGAPTNMPGQICAFAGTAGSSLDFPKRMVPIVLEICAGAS